jgi:hypothetical protein
MPLHGRFTLPTTKKSGTLTAYRYFEILKLGVVFDQMQLATKVSNPKKLLHLVRAAKS